MPFMKILLLEDDPILSEIIEEFLVEHGLHVTLFYDGKEALDAIFENKFDILVLDINVPSLSGFELLKALKEAGIITPTIFITSLSQINDVKKGFALGAEDYLKKPFELKELLLRVKSISKRVFYHKADEKISIGNGVYFDLDSNRIQRDGETIHLSKKESLILKLLLRHRGKIVTPQMIFENAWDYEDEPSEMSLRTYIKNIRKTIGKELIENTRGQGYMLVAG
jgi:DNA-binding response OmpR family regulator